MIYLPVNKHAVLIKNNFRNVLKYLIHNYMTGVIYLISKGMYIYCRYVITMVYSP